MLKAPLPYWDKNMIARAPAALEFLRRVDIWFTDWVPTLRHGMLNDYSSALADRKPARDPAAPEE
ncbi:hypothetical protein [Asaia prunellae]|uniref:hypothetical protein n=1 Tax=Asaia prunellae TaxID=610245 RepID=UPI0004728C6A|nr:hypothetical protein [Asaia prunellae]